tara:strand:- start:2604 stop:3074 length:471 start_codon:yes stop_codon:yes gene_type:complete
MKFKELAGKAGKGHKGAVQIFLMMLPKGGMPEGMEPEEYAGQLSDDENVEDYEVEEDSFFEYLGVTEEEVENDDPMEDEQGTGFQDLKLKKSIFDALEPLDLPEEAVKAICGAIYDGVIGGDIFPRLKKGQDKAHGSEEEVEEDVEMEEEMEEEVY